MSDDAKASRLDEFIARPRRALWILGLPIMAGMGIQTIYMLADMFFVGLLSPEALTALAFNMPLVFMGLGIVFGLGSGVTAIIAQFIGARDKKGADRAAEHAVALGAVVSALFVTAAYAWGRPLLGLLGVPPEVMPLAWDYFSVLAGGYAFVVMSVFFRSILSGEGDMKTPMMIQGAGTVLNIFLDPVCIFTLGLGVKGAALATVLGQALAASVFVYLLFVKKRAYVTFDLKDFHPDGAVLARIFKLGMPASFSFVVMALGGAVFNRILVEFSGDAVAAFQVGSRVDQIYVLPIVAIAASLVTLVGMFRGASRIDLARSILRYALGRSVLLGVAFGAVFFAFAPECIALFTASPEIRALGTTYLRISVLGYPFLAVAMLTARALQGLGHGLPVLVLTLMRVLLISAPMAYLAVAWLGKPVEWVWASIVVGMVVTALVGLYWLHSALSELEAAAGPRSETPAPGVLPIEPV